MKDHPIAALFPLLEGAEFDALVLSIKTHGFDSAHPVIVYDDQILDGRNRYRAAKAAGVSPVVRKWTGGNPWDFVWKENAVRRQLEPGQKTAIAYDFLLGSEAWRTERERIRHERAVDAGKGKAAVSPDTAAPDQRARVQLAAFAGTSPATAARVIAVRAKAPDQFERLKRGEVSAVAALTTSGALDYDGDEWYTPAPIINMVYEVLGAIDLDPASNAHAQKTVKAARFFTKDDDGIAQEWRGRVFCNPPYSFPLIERFSEKLIAEVDARRTTSAIYLVNNCTDAAWFQSLLHRFPVCFTKGRLAFEQRSGAKFQTRQGQAIFFSGATRAQFSTVFGQIGTVMERCP